MLDEKIDSQEFENLTLTSYDIISHKTSKELREYEHLEEELGASIKKYTKVIEDLRRDDLKKLEFSDEILNQEDIKEPELSDKTLGQEDIKEPELSDKTLGQEDIKEPELSDKTLGQEDIKEPGFSDKALDQNKWNKEEAILVTVDSQKIKESKSDLIDKMLKVTCEKLSAQNASIFLISKDGVLERAGMYGYDLNQQEIGNEWLPDEGYKISDSFFTGKAAQPGDNSPYGTNQYTEVFEGNDKYENSIFKQYHEKLGGLKSAIAIPLSGRNKTYGVLRIINAVGENTSGIFPIQDCGFILNLITLSTSIASRLSDFRRDVKSSLLEYFSHLLIQSTCDTEEIYQKILDLLVQNPETAFKAAILRVRIEDDWLKVKAKSLFVGINENRDDKDRKMNEKSLLSSVANEKKRLIVQDIQSLINVNSKEAIGSHSFENEKWIKENKFQCFACFPLMTKENEVQATLTLYTGYNYEFHSDSVRFLQGIVDQLSAFIFRIKLETQKQDLQATSEGKFNTLAEKWKNDTQTSLFMAQRCTDPSYQRIIGMGQRIVPLLLKKISEPSGEDWFWALSAITDENPVKLEHRGIIDKVIEDWIKWGRSKGYEC